MQYPFRLGTTVFVFSFVLQVVEFRPVAQNVYYEMPFSVNFVAQSYITVPYTDADSPR